MHIYLSNSPNHEKGEKPLKSTVMTSELIDKGNDPTICFLKGQNFYISCKYEEALSYFNKAIQLDPSEASYYNSKGLALEGLGKDSEALVSYARAIEVNPNVMDYHYRKILTLQKLGRAQEAVDYSDRAIDLLRVKIGPKSIKFYESKALELQRMGKDQDARVCLRKVQELKARNEASFFLERGEYQKAIPALDQAIEMNPTSASNHFNKGIALVGLSEYKDADICFDKAIAIWPKKPLFYCVRGRNLKSLNKEQHAFSDFKKAQEIQRNAKDILELPISEIEYVTMIVNSILELEKEDEIAERILGQLLDNKKFIEQLKVFKVTKEKVIADLLERIEEKCSGKVPQEKIDAVSKLKEDYKRLHKEMIEELSPEVDNFYKNFGDFDIAPDDQTKVKEYFKAFVGTFRFVFEGSQAIENENCQLDVGCLLSMFASFSVIDTSGITSVGDFFSMKEIQTSAKSMLELFFDSVYLNSVIGKIAEKIVLDLNKREYIVSITEKDLDYHKRRILQKISKLCEQISEPIDIDEYKQLYNTPAAQLGHLDANDLIQEYLAGRINPNSAQEQFIEKTLERQRVMNEVETEEIKIKIKEKNGGAKGKCCNIF